MVIFFPPYGPVTPSCVPTELTPCWKISEIAMKSQGNLENVYNFFIKFYKEKLSRQPDSNWNVSMELLLWVIAFLWSSTWRLPALLHSACDVLRILTSHSMQGLCADFNFVYTAINCVTLTQQQSSSGAAGDLTAMPRWPYHVSTGYISECIATACILCIVTLPQQMKMPLDVSLL